MGNENSQQLNQDEDSTHFNTQENINARKQMALNTDPQQKTMSKKNKKIQEKEQIKNIGLNDQDSTSDNTKKIFDKVDDESNVNFMEENNNISTKPYYQLTQSNIMAINQSRGINTIGQATTGNNTTQQTNKRTAQMMKGSLSVSLEQGDINKKLNTSNGAITLPPNTKVMNVKLFYGEDTQQKVFDHNSNKWIYTSSQELKESLKILSSSQISSSARSQFIKDMANRSGNANSQMSIAQCNIFADIMGSMEYENQCQIISVEHDCVDDPNNPQPYSSIKVTMTENVVNEFQERCTELQQQYIRQNMDQNNMGFKPHTQSQNYNNNNNNPNTENNMNSQQYTSGQGNEMYGEYIEDEEDEEYNNMPIIQQNQQQETLKGQTYAQGFVGEDDFDEPEEKVGDIGSIELEESEVYKKK